MGLREEAADYYTDLYDAKLAEPNLKPLHVGYRLEKERVQANFMAGWDAAVAQAINLASLQASYYVSEERKMGALDVQMALAILKSGDVPLDETKKIISEMSDRIERYEVVLGEIALMSRDMAELSAASYAKDVLESELELQEKVTTMDEIYYAKLKSICSNCGRSYGEHSILKQECPIWTGDKREWGFGPGVFKHENE